MNKNNKKRDVINMINKDFTLEHSITILNNIVRNSTIHYDSSDDSVLFFQTLLDSTTRRYLELILKDSITFEDYILNNSEDNNVNIVDISELWKCVEQKFNVKLIFLPNKKEFIEQEALLQTLKENRAQLLSEVAF